MSAKSDSFLHILTVMDADTPEGPATGMISGEELTGVIVLDHAVLFGRSGNLLDGVSFSISGDGKLKILVCDLKPGDWAVRRNGELVNQKIPATADGKCVYFEGDPGSYELRLLDDGEQRD